MSKARSHNHDHDHDTDEQEVQATTNPQATPHMNRRNMLRLTGAAVGTVGAGVGAQQAGLDVSPVDTAEAVGPLVIAGGALAGSAAIGWALREYEVVGSDDPAEGLTPEVLQEDVYNTARTRKSTNASTFIDNQNIIDNLDHAAYADAKIAAIEALNNEQSESEVESAALTAIDDYETTLKSNLLKSWNESVNELENLYNAVSSHSNLSVGDLFRQAQTSDSVPDDLNASYSYRYADSYAFTFGSNEYSLPDGSTLSVRTLSSEYSSLPTMSPTLSSFSNAADYWIQIDSSSVIGYLSLYQWTNMFSSITDTMSSVRSGISTWVSEVYGQVQAGELDTEDLLTPRELAEMSADKEHVNQAIADLMALNIPVDLEREAHIHIPEYGANLVGRLAVTSDVSVASGDTIDPTSTDEDYYFTYDVSQGKGIWTSYNSGVDGGVVTFTSEPYEGHTYTIHTTAGESVTVSASDFSANDSGNYTVDISSQLETAITEIDEVEYQSESDETQYETVQLQNEFTVEKIEDSDGNEVDSMDFEQSEPQDDTNYISEDEWQQMQDRQEELIEKYEESQDDDGVTIGVGSGLETWQIALALGVPGLGIAILVALAAKEAHPAT